MPDMDSYLKRIARHSGVSKSTSAGRVRSASITGQAADFEQIAYAGDRGGVPVQTINPDYGKEKKGKATKLRRALNRY